MGVSTVASYTGAQIFEAIGLGDDVVDATSPARSASSAGSASTRSPPRSRPVTDGQPGRPEERAHRKLELGGEYQWRREGELHLFNPETVFKLQHATRAKRYDIFKEYTAKVDDQSKKLMTLRGLFEFDERSAADPDRRGRAGREIVKRFSTGAMSYGSISAEAHETLAVAMNQLGAKSNTGEGGEDPDRLYDPERRSSIKQVASGRFGVTAEYLTNSDDIQIKMAQGAKPGEGGQLPGHKVYPWIAKTRHSTPGRRADQPAAAPRHLLDRGSQAADPRSEERQPGGPDPRQARRRDRRRHGRRRRRQGEGRRRADLRPRRWHRAPAR